MKKLAVCSFLIVSLLAFWACSDDDPAEPHTGYITVISPAGDEVWLMGTTCDIKWDDDLSEGVKIDLYKDGAYHSTIASSTESDGIYSWAIPAGVFVGDDLKIRVMSVSDPSIYGQSENHFSIESPEWTKSFGSTGRQMARALLQTNDLGYLFTGVSEENVYLVRTDWKGDIVWSRTIGELMLFEGGMAAAESNDGGFVITGYTNVHDADHNVLLLKVDAVGNTVWNKWIGGGTWGMSIQRLSGGGFIIAGFKNYDPGADQDVYLARINDAGELIWEKTYGSDLKELAASVKETSDGGFIVTGRKVINDSDEDIYLLKTNSSGEQLWEKTFAYTGKDMGNTVIETSDGGFVIAGLINSYLGIIKTNAAGEQLWNYSYNGSYADFDGAEIIQQTSDGGFILTGYTTTTSNYYDILLIKTGANGEKQWDLTFGDTGYDRGCSVMQTAEGGYIAIGTLETPLDGESDLYIIKTNGTE